MNMQFFSLPVHGGKITGAVQGHTVLFIIYLLIIVLKDNYKLNNIQDVPVKQK